MSDQVWFRRAKPDDLQGVMQLSDLAFGGQDEDAIARQLWDDSDSLLSLVAVDDEEVIGRIKSFCIQSDGAPLGAGPGPMSVRPGLQNQGAGSTLIRRCPVFRDADLSQGILRLKGRIHAAHLH